MTAPSEESDRPTILIVDDEMDMRIFMSTLFETSGFDPVAVRDGQAGLSRAEAIRPDVIVLDVMMPGEGGALMYKALKANERLRHIPVVMCSAVSHASFQHYLKMLGSQAEQPVPEPDAYVEKPPEPDVLLDVVERILSSSAGQG